MPRRSRIHESTPQEQIEHDIRWRARWSGLSDRRADERARQLAAMKPPPEPLEPMTEPKPKRR